MAIDFCVAIDLRGSTSQAKRRHADDVMKAYNSFRDSYELYFPDEAYDFYPYVISEFLDPRTFKTLLTLLALNSLKNLSARCCFCRRLTNHDCQLFSTTVDEERAKPRGKVNQHQE